MYAIGPRTVATRSASPSNPGGRRHRGRVLPRREADRVHPRPRRGAPQRVLRRQRRRLLPPASPPAGAWSSTTAASGGRFSPSGDQILFVAKSAAEDHKAIWIVNAEGGAPGAAADHPRLWRPADRFGEFGCYAPSWSPDGEQIVFTRNDAPTDDSGERIYIVNADGSGLVQISDGKDDLPTWGTPAD